MRYIVAKTVFVSDFRVGDVQASVPHPDAPRDGFDTALEAEAWLHGMFLAPHIWRVEPWEPTP